MPEAFAAADHLGQETSLEVTGVVREDKRAPGGRELTITRPDPSGWTVPEHASAVTVRYKVFGDRIVRVEVVAEPAR